MSEIEIGGQIYRISKIAAMRQLHIVRRVAPALLGAVGGVAALQAAAEDGMNIRQVLDRMEPFMEALSNMKDEDVDYVVDNCLAVVERKVSGDRGWQKVGISGQLMYDDMDLLVILRLTWEAGRENLEGFISAFRQMFPNLLMEAPPP